jgi:hypothetical protein
MHMTLTIAFDRQDHLKVGPGETLEDYEFIALKGCQALRASWDLNLEGKMDRIIENNGPAEIRFLVIPGRARIPKDFDLAGAISEFVYETVERELSK